MDTVLIVLGMLLIATGLTLLATAPRTWVVALAQGVGVQAVIGAFASGVQIGWLTEHSAQMSIQDRVITAVQGVPFHSAGWTGRAIFEAATNDKSPGAMGDLNDYLPIAVGQMVIVAFIIGWRKMKDEGLTDPVQLLLWGLLIANSVCNAMYPWWAQ